MTTLKQYQEIVEEWAAQHDIPYWGPFRQLAHMYQEGGELARAISHHHGEEKVKPGEPVPSIRKELGDILLAVIFMANREGFELDDALTEAIQDKLYDRDKDRFPKRQDR
jgi:NTP pyrophosphatase (non-canonical NTP hydrolase)